MTIVNLQNECAKVKIELQEQKKCVKRLTLELDKTKLPVRVTEKLVNASSETEAVEFNAAGAEVFVWLYIYIYII